MIETKDNYTRGKLLTKEGMMNEEQDEAFCTYKRKDSQGEPCLGFTHNVAGGCGNCTHNKKK